MLDITRLPNDIYITAKKQDLIDLVNFCLLKNMNEQKRMFPEYLTIKQLAEYIGYSEPSLYKKVAQSEIPCYKIAGKLLFKKTEIDAWLFEFRQPTITEKVGELLRKEAKL